MSNTPPCLIVPPPMMAAISKVADLCDRTLSCSDEDSPRRTQNCESSNCNHAQDIVCSKEVRSCTEDFILKRLVSRKREASNLLLESRKRRDVDSTVPSAHFSQDLLMKSQDSSEFPILDCRDSPDLDSSSPADSSDGLSSVDSGIDTSSKGNSPSHSIEILNSQEDGLEDSPSVCMETDECAEPSNANQGSSRCEKNESPVLISEDLHDLHLTDRAKQLKTTVLKPPVSKSLFSHVAPSIYFASTGEEVSPFAPHILPLLKWKLSTITPVLIKDIVQKSGFTLVDADTPEEWLGTWGKHLKCKVYKQIKPYQKVNHYPGSFHLGRKDKLWDNYKRMQNRHGVDAFNFFPKTFHLPHDINLLKNVWDTSDEKCWIIKPPASARGTGVKVIHKWSQIPKNKPIMVQQYLNNPYLINGTKFDLRIYIFVSSFEPLRVYMFDDGLVRFASEKYSVSNKTYSNRFIHLTNYSINRKSSSYTANNDENLCQGHKWTLKAFWTYMASCGVDVDKIKESITDMVLKTVLCAEGPICRLMKTYARSTYSCYELFGFDIMLDNELRAWLLEVNISPSLHIRSALDAKIKGPMVKDMLNMAAFLVPEKRSDQGPSDYGIMCPVANKHKALRNRCLSKTEKKKHSLYTFDYEKGDILSKLTPDDIRCLIESEDEYNRCGSFVRIFPSTYSSKYFRYFEHNRYYNFLLNAWESKYHNNRQEGVTLLQDFCDRKYHLQAGVQSDDSHSLTDESEIEITVH